MPKKNNRAVRERAYIETMLFCGLRSGEALALVRADIDFKERLLSVSKAVSYGSGNAPTVEPTAKTASSNRFVPIPEPLVETLRAACEGLEPFEPLLQLLEGGIVTMSGQRRGSVSHYVDKDPRLRRDCRRYRGA